MYKPNTTYRLIALFMALLIFATSSSIAIDIHYCSGKIKSFDFWGKAKSCHNMAIKNRKNCAHLPSMNTELGANCDESPKNCCENKSISLKSDHNQQVQPAELAFNDQRKSSLSAFHAIYLTDFDNIYFNVIVHQHYKPPLISRDIPVLIQSFLF